jgi:hypothetical protein
VGMGQEGNIKSPAESESYTQYIKQLYKCIQRSLCNVGKETRHNKRDSLFFSQQYNFLGCETLYDLLKINCTGHEVRMFHFALSCLSETFFIMVSEIHAEIPAGLNEKCPQFCPI